MTDALPEVVRANLDDPFAQLSGNLADTRRLRFEVAGTEQLTPHMQRLELTADELDGFTYAPGQDVMLLVAADGNRPVRRRYTIRHLDPARRLLTLDVVLHGDGPGERWVRSARPGDRIEGIGPRGKVTTLPAADWHLFMGDESALPAIFAMTESLPGDSVATVVLEVPDPADEQELNAPARTRMTWLLAACARTRCRPRPTGAAAGPTPVTASQPGTPSLRSAGQASPRRAGAAGPRQREPDWPAAGQLANHQWDAARQVGEVRHPVHGQPGSVALRDPGPDRAGRAGRAAHQGQARMPVAPAERDQVLAGNGQEAKMLAGRRSGRHFDRASVADRDDHADGSRRLPGRHRRDVPAAQGQAGRPRALDARIDEPHRADAHALCLPGWRQRPVPLGPAVDQRGSGHGLGRGRRARRAVGTVRRVMSSADPRSGTGARPQRAGRGRDGHREHRHGRNAAGADAAQVPGPPAPDRRQQTGGRGLGRRLQSGPQPALKIVHDASRLPGAGYRDCGHPARR